MRKDDLLDYKLSMKASRMIEKEHNLSQRMEQLTLQQREKLREKREAQEKKFEENYERLVSKNEEEFQRAVEIYSDL